MKMINMFEIECKKNCKHYSINILRTHLKNEALQNRYGLRPIKSLISSKIPTNQLNNLNQNLRKSKNE